MSQVCLGHILQDLKSYVVKILTPEGFEGIEENQPVIPDSIDKALRQRVTAQRSEVSL